jgi:photosystem II stability/assembly factor-like uncharacterized protein
MDGGKSWSAANAGLTAMSITRVAVDPHRPSTIWALGWTRLFNSEDDGRTWRAGNWGEPGLFASAFAIDQLNPNIIYAGLDNQEVWAGRLFQSTDGGTSWTASLLHCGIENLAPDPRNPNTIYAGTDWCGLYNTTDDGVSWNQVYASAEVGTIAIDPLDANTLYMAAVGNKTSGGLRIYKTLDGGVNWTSANSGLPDAGTDSVAALLIDPKIPNTLYAGVRDGLSGKSTLYGSTDGAASWNWIALGYPLAIDPQSPNVLYAALGDYTGVDAVFRSTDQGLNWTDVSAGLAGSYVGNLAFDPVDPSTVFAATNAGIFSITFVP